MLHESTKIENATFPYKTALSRLKVKAYRKGVQNKPIKMNGVLPLTTLRFENLISI